MYGLSDSYRYINVNYILSPFKPCSKMNQNLLQQVLLHLSAVNDRSSLLHVVVK